VVERDTSYSQLVIGEGAVQEVAERMKVKFREVPTRMTGG
jgi:hypothetical protein